MCCHAGVYDLQVVGDNGVCRTVVRRGLIHIPLWGIVARMDTITYSVPGVSCEHCRAAITGEVSQVAGVQAVAVDLDAKTVTVTGEPLDTAAVVAAIDEAGYDVAL